MWRIIFKNKFKIWQKYFGVALLYLILFPQNGIATKDTILSKQRLDSQMNYPAQNDLANTLSMRGHLVQERFLKPKQKTQNAQSFAIGHPHQGCLLGGIPMKKTGNGFQLIRSSRQRYYGHPDTIRYLQQLGEDISTLGLGVLWIGDLSTFNGGKIPKDHASHQTGLDADIWLRLGDHYMEESSSQKPTVISMLNKSRKVDLSVFGAKQAFLIYLAASDIRVAKIFVNPAIKKELCKLPWPSRDWLYKIRPWDGHDAHFHVRLHCSIEDTLCVESQITDFTDGCNGIRDELASFRPGEPVGSIPFFRRNNTLENINSVSKNVIKKHCEINRNLKNEIYVDNSKNSLNKQRYKKQKEKPKIRIKKLLALYQSLKRYYGRTEGSM